MPLSCEAKSKETLCAMRDLASFDKEVTSSQCLAPRRYTDFMTSLALHLSFGFPVVSIIRVSSSGSDRSNRFGSPAPAPAAAAGDPHGDALEEENDDNEGAAAAAAAAAAGGGRGGAARVEKDLSARGLFRRPLPLCFIIIIIISRSNSIDEFTPHSPKDKKGQQGGGRQAPQYEQRRRRKRDEPLPLVPKQGTSSSSLLPSSLSSSSSSPSSSSSSLGSRLVVVVVVDAQTREEKRRTMSSLERRPHLRLFFPSKLGQQDGRRCPPPPHPTSPHTAHTAHSSF